MPVYLFSAEWPGTFTCENVLKQREEVRVKITKLSHDTLEPDG